MELGGRRKNKLNIYSIILFLLLILLLQLNDVSAQDNINSMINSLKSVDRLTYVNFKNLDKKIKNYKLYAINLSEDTQHYPLIVASEDNIESIRREIKASNLSEKEIMGTFADTLLNYKTFYITDQTGNHYYLILKENNDISDLESKQESSNKLLEDSQEESGIDIPIIWYIFGVIIISVVFFTLKVNRSQDKDNSISDAKIKGDYGEEDTVDPLEQSIEEVIASEESMMAMPKDELSEIMGLPQNMVLNMLVRFDIELFDTPQVKGMLQSVARGTLSLLNKLEAKKKYCETYTDKLRVLSPKEEELSKINNLIEDMSYISKEINDFNNNISVDIKLINRKWENINLMSKDEIAQSVYGYRDILVEARTEIWKYLMNIENCMVDAKKYLTKYRSDFAFASSDIEVVIEYLSGFEVIVDTIFDRLESIDMNQSLVQECIKQLVNEYQNLDKTIGIIEKQNNNILDNYEEVYQKIDDYDFNGYLEIVEELINEMDNNNQVIKEANQKVDKLEDKFNKREDVPVDEINKMKKSLDSHFEKFESIQQSIIEERELIKELAAINDKEKIKILSKSKKMEEEILKSLAKCKEEVCVTAYDFTNGRILDELSRLAEDKKIRIIIDSSSRDEGRNKEKKGKLKSWFSNNKNVEVRAYDRRSYGRYAKMHRKEIVIDNQIVITGSANFTYSGLSKNIERMLIIEETETANKLFNEFNDLWKQSRSI
ncbi:phospholipase D-like domain-containing protein [Orenia marismortui]|uniref:phospholipase D-like domain-containing protein n=1 Tax=Orenia marismortui TaxID=46469 RepID=UPI00035F139D|nr:phospholipase D-like domain-containing protein [Orenia marismortui]